MTGINVLVIVGLRAGSLKRALAEGAVYSPRDAVAVNVFHKLTPLPRKSERVERFEHLTRSRRAHGRRKCRRGTHRDKLPWASARHGAQRDRLAGDALESGCTAWQTARRDRQRDATAGSGP